MQVAFSHGVASNSIRSFGKQRERKDDQGNVTGLRDLASDGTEIPNNMQLTDAEICEDFTDSTSSSISKKKGEYREPWVIYISIHSLKPKPWLVPKVNLLG